MKHSKNFIHIFLLAAFCALITNACTSHNQTETILNSDGLRNAIAKSTGHAFPYTFAPGLYNNRAPVVNNAGKWGYIDSLGNQVIPFTYNDVRNFTGDLAPVKVDNKWGYINSAGVLISPAKYDDAQEFSEGMARVELNNRFGYLDNTGTEKISIQYFAAAPSFKEGVAGVGVSPDVNFIDKTGQIICAPCAGLSSHSLNLKYGLRIVQEGVQGLYFYANKNCTNEFGRKFCFASDFSEGIAVVKLPCTLVGCLCADPPAGWIDRNGNLKQLPLYNAMSEQINGYSLVTNKNTSFPNYSYNFINTNWQRISQTDFQWAFFSVNDGCAPVGNNNFTFGYVNTNGHMLLNYQYDVAYPFNNGRACVLAKGTQQYIDKTGKVIYPH